LESGSFVLRKRAAKKIGLSGMHDGGIYNPLNFERKELQRLNRRIAQPDLQDPRGLELDKKEKRRVQRVISQSTISRIPPAGGGISSLAQQSIASAQAKQNAQLPMRRAVVGQLPLHAPGSHGQRTRTTVQPRQTFDPEIEASIVSSLDRRQQQSRRAAIRAPGDAAEGTLDAVQQKELDKSISKLKKRGLATEANIEKARQAILRNTSRTVATEEKILRRANKGFTLRQKQNTLLNRVNRSLSRANQSINKRLPSLSKFGGGSALSGIGKGFGRAALPAALLLPSLLPQDPKSAGVAGASAFAQTGLGVGLTVGAFNPLLGVIAGVTTGLLAAEQAAQDFAKDAALKELSSSSNEFVKALQYASTGADGFAERLAAASDKFAKELDESATLIFEQASDRGVADTLKATSSTLGSIFESLGDVIQENIPGIDTSRSGGATALETFVPDIRALREFIAPEVFQEAERTAIAGEVEAATLQRQRSVAGVGTQIRGQFERGRTKPLSSTERRALGIEQASAKDVERFAEQVTFRREQGATEASLLQFDTDFFAEIGADVEKDLNAMREATQRLTKAHEEASHRLQLFSSDLANVSGSIRLASEGVRGFDDRLAVIAGGRSGFKASTTNLSTLQNFRAASPQGYRAAVEATAGRGIADMVGLQQEVAKALPGFIEDQQKANQFLML
jgi:hypothetical protein